jgi:hypothetical protein
VVEFEGDQEVFRLAIDDEREEQAERATVLDLRASSYWLPNRALGSEDRLVTIARV